MTIRELVQCNLFRPIAIPDPERVITGVYIGDLLSWVMGRAQSGNIWITIMSNLNIVAVASLTDTACILVAEGVDLPQDVIDTAFAKSVNILSSQQSTYQIATALSKLL